MRYSPSDVLYSGSQLNQIVFLFKPGDERRGVETCPRKDLMRWGKCVRQNHGSGDQTLVNLMTERAKTLGEYSFERRNRQG